MISVAQCRAARALLDWTQDDLATCCGTRWTTKRAPRDIDGVRATTCRVGWPQGRGTGSHGAAGHRGVIQGLWPLDQSNLGRPGGRALFDLPLLIDRGSASAIASIPEVPTEDE
jgi:hypothetical protein